MKKNVSDCQLQPAAVDVKGDNVARHLLVGSANTVDEV